MIKKQSTVVLAIWVSIVIYAFTPPFQKGWVDIVVFGMDPVGISVAS